jgi:hypothetical protein
MDHCLETANAPGVLPHIDLPEWAERVGEAIRQRVEELTGGLP